MIAVVTSIVVLLVVLLATWLSHKSKTIFTYWAERGIPGPKPTLLGFGNMTQSLKRGNLIHSYWYNEFGPFYGTYFMAKPFLAVGDTEALKDILIRNFNKFTDKPSFATVPIEAESLINTNGLQWRHDRAVISPSFSSGKMKAMFTLMKQSYINLENEFEILSSQKVDVYTKALFSKLTTMVIARCAFATEINPFKDEKNILFVHLSSIFKANFTDRLIMVGKSLLPKFIKNYFELTFLPKSSMKYLQKMCIEIIRQRRANPRASNEYPDLLQLLLDSQNSSISDDTSNSGKKFDDMKIIANLILFFIAGYETTSSLLFWASYALMSNPEIQDKLYDQVKRAKEESGNLDYETLSSIKYLDAFIDETLRMYPPVTIIMRLCIEDHILPNGLKVEKGTPISIPVYGIHNDSKNFPEPDKFNPDRFMPENKDQIPQCAFLGFVQGPRNCIGMRFALLEAKMTLANLVLKYKFVKSPNTPEKMVINEKAFILEPVGELPMRIVKRT